MGDVGATLVVAQPALAEGNHKGCPYHFITHIASLPEFLCCPTFKAQFEKILKIYSNSENSVKKHISELQNNPNYRSNIYPGFGQQVIMKTRIPLPEHKHSASHGLRFIFLVSKEKNVIVPLLIFKKGLFKEEKQVKQKIIDNLKTILSEIDKAACIRS